MTTIIETKCAMCAAPISGNAAGWRDAGSEVTHVCWGARAARVNDATHHDFSHTTPQAFNAGDRVALHPATDAWMRGERYGMVQRRSSAYVFVRMDSGRLLSVRPEYLAIVSM